MGLIDYLLLALTVILAAELVIELRRKRWWPAVGSAVILGLVLAISYPIYIFLWNKVTGNP